MMLIIICMLAPTHWTRFVCATKSPLPVQLERVTRGGLDRLDGLADAAQPDDARKEGREQDPAAGRGDHRHRIPSDVETSTMTFVGDEQDRWGETEPQLVTVSPRLGRLRPGQRSTDTLPRISPPG